MLVFIIQPILPGTQLLSFCGEHFCLSQPQFEKDVPDAGTDLGVVDVALVSDVFFAAWIKKVFLEEPLVI